MARPQLPAIYKIAIDLTFEQALANTGSMNMIRDDAGLQLLLRRALSAVTRDKGARLVECETSEVGMGLQQNFGRIIIHRPVGRGIYSDMAASQRTVSIACARMIVLQSRRGAV